MSFSFLAKIIYHIILVLGDMILKHCWKPADIESVTEKLISYTTVYVMLPLLNKCPESSINLMILRLMLISSTHIVVNGGKLTMA